MTNLFTAAEARAVSAAGDERLRDERLPEPKPRRRWFVPALLVIFLIGLGLRIAFALVWATPLGFVPGDELYYQQQGQGVADGKGFDDTLLGQSGPSAAHPPVMSVVSAGLDLIGLDSRDRGSVDPQRVGLAVICALAVPLTGLVGRRLAGSAVGLVAAGIAALHPLWVQMGPNLWPEGLYLVVVAALMLLALQLIDRPTWWRAAILGVALGICTLTRSEAVLFIPLLVLPVAYVAAPRWRRRLALAAIATAACLLTVSPWVVRTYSLFGGVTLSTQQGNTVAGSNCEQTYYGDRLGGFTFDCWLDYYATVIGKQGTDLNQLDQSNADQAEALRYAKDHAGRLPVVAGARVLRTWSLFHSGDQLAWDVTEHRNRTFQTVGQYVEWVLLPLAVAGAILVPRGAWRRWIVPAAVPVLITIVSILIYGSTRFRAVAEPSVAVFAAFAIVAAFQRVRGRPTGTRWDRRRDRPGPIDDRGDLPLPSSS